MNFNINKKTILIIGFPWPYSYGGHRTTKLCRELSKNYNVICLTRPLFRYLDKINLEIEKVSKSIVELKAKKKEQFSQLKIMLRAEKQKQKVIQVLLGS